MEDGNIKAITNEVSNRIGDMATQGWNNNDTEVHKKLVGLERRPLRDPFPSNPASPSSFPHYCNTGREAQTAS